MGAVYSLLSKWGVIFEFPILRSITTAAWGPRGVAGFPLAARVARSGYSQAVRLPKQFRFQVSEVEIARRGREVILREPRRNLGEAFAALASMPADFMAGGRKDRAPQRRESL